MNTMNKHNKAKVKNIFYFILKNPQNVVTWLLSVLRKEKGTEAHLWPTADPRDQHTYKICK